MTKRHANDNRRPSRSLSFEDAVQIHLMHMNGMFQNRIASAFDVNPGRVNEVVKERKHIGSKAVALLRRSAA